jgi:subtilisin family serine protease
MLRTVFTAALVLLVIASAATTPAYSLAGAVTEAGPLTSYLDRAAPRLQSAEDVINIHGFAVDKKSAQPDFGGIIDLGELRYNGNPSRTLVYGSGNLAALSSNAHVIGFGGGSSTGASQPLLGVAVSESPLPSNLGFSYATDSPLQFDSFELPVYPPAAVNMTGRFSGSSIIGSDTVISDYKINGSGTKVAIVDTGTDFGNPDITHSVARDENGVPIMLDADGQGIVLARATYIATIDPVTGKMLDAGYTPKSKLPDGMTSWVYLNDTGAVYLRVSHGDIPVYNSLYPYFGTPVVNATATVDWKIGETSTDYIRSQSGIYRFGVIYQTQLHFGTITFALVPVLVVDSEKSGVYDTIIPDMYSAWYFFTRNELARVGGDAVEHLYPPPSFDFTDDTPIKIGDGNEFLVFDYNDDGFPDFSAGTVGARVVDLWQVISNKTEPALGIESGYGGVVVADLLEPMDPGGEYFGVMYDLQGHGTSTAATVSSKGMQGYDLYDNGTLHSLAGIAPGAQIIPVKALWAGDSIYGWLYAAGFDLNATDAKWRYTGNHKADIISNSWGIAPFPLLQYGPGYDIMSMYSSLLSVPGLISDDYPGTILVNSVGNNGLGYGSVGSPNASPLSISVGSTTNNVHIGYNGFDNVTRFGNSAAPFDEVSDFSSRGPGVFGDPKPELMAVGSYAFTPTLVNLKNLESTPDDPNNAGAFALFGGTSMAAPMVAGVAALVLEDMNARGVEPDPFKVKSMMMSSAKDLKNDPFVQGSGRVDAVAAIDLAQGKGRMVSAYTEDTVKNVLSLMAGAIYQYNDTLSIIDGAQDITARLGDTKFKESRWFAGHIEQGESSSTEITVENPTANPIDVEVLSVVEKLIARYEIHNTTRPFETDPVYSNTTEFGYIPNYYDLNKEIGGIPENADLMVARVNFPFESFMNLTEFFGDHLRLASVYSYDWSDADSDGNVSYAETSMINRGGSWGTIQELRVSDPVEKFKSTPLIGVYPVPEIFSFWQGSRAINSTAMNYTLTVEFYERQANPSITLEKEIVPTNKALITVAPNDETSVRATIRTSEDTLPGVYHGSIIVKPENSIHQVLMPVSYIVVSKPVPKDVPVVFSPDRASDPNELGLRPNGYVGGLFDMTSRYAAGDWRSYYFNVSDETITSMSLKISWPHNSTSINAMTFGPDGKAVASSVPAGVFETFAGWPTNDWLGTTSASEGGAFYFSQNSGENSTLLFVPINQTGVYTVLLHNTLFHGNSLYEPVQLEAKFSTILPDIAAPVISINLPKVVGGLPNKIPVTLVEENPAGWSYTVDAGDPITPEIAYNGTANARTFDILLDGTALVEGPHRLRIDSHDSVGHTASFISPFEVDSTPPSVGVFTQTANDTALQVLDRIVTSRDIVLSWNITDTNGVLTPVAVAMPNSTSTESQSLSSSAPINATSMQEGEYEFSVVAQDLPGNRAERIVQFVVDRTVPTVSLSLPSGTDAKGRAVVALGADDHNLQSLTLLVGDRKSVNVTGMKEYVLDTTELPDGQYTLKLVAADAAGNENEAATTLSVLNMMPLLLSMTLIGLAAGGGIASAIWLAVMRRRRAAADESASQ